MACVPHLKTRGPAHRTKPHSYWSTESSWSFSYLPLEPRPLPVVAPPNTPAGSRMTSWHVLLHVFTHSPTSVRSICLYSASLVNCTLSHRPHPRMPLGDGYVEKVEYKLACVVLFHFKGGKTYKYISGNHTYKHSQKWQEYGDLFSLCLSVVSDIFDSQHVFFCNRNKSYFWCSKGASVYMLSFGNSSSILSCSIKCAHTHAPGR